jgi:CheY-like chemotaxis protein/lambda repressor-like predicted transcriptional regulator
MDNIVAIRFDIASYEDLSMSTAALNGQSVTPLSIISLDDDPDFREYIAGTLAGEGHAVTTVSTPEELYKRASESLPDVMMLDIKMGKHSGEEVLAEIRTRWPKQCVIVVTGYPSLDSMRDTFKKDVFDYIAKPFSMEDMRRVLNQASHELGLGQKPMDRLRGVLGRQIRLARTERGWTLRELSELSSVSVSQLSSIERGTHLPSVESLVAISLALESKPSDWFAAAGF